VKNFFVAAGMNSAGIANAGGAGLALARWMDQGYPEEDLWPVDIRRFYGWQRNKLYLKDMVTEALGNVFADHWPFKQPKMARPVLCSPFHDRLKNMGACFGVVAGWERPNWFAPEGVTAEYVYSWGRQNWFNHSAAEHKAVRDNVGMYDLSSMGKFLLQGRDAEKVLQKICANDVAVVDGKVVYTQLLNERGGIEADLTVTRFERDKFYIVTSAANRMRDFNWIQKHIHEDAHAILTDVTDAHAVLAIMGPRSRDLLAHLTDADLSNESFAFATAQQIDIAYARPWAIRISFAGELGWELHIPTPFATGVFDAAWVAGKKFDARLVGLHAVDSLRLEKGYPHWGSDIGPDDTPFEAGLSFAVRLNKGDFIGREALLKQKEKGVTRRLTTFTVKNPEPLLYHDEPIYRDGQLVSENTHGAYAPTLGCSMGMCYLNNSDGISDEWLASGNFEINIEGKLYPIEIQLEAPYDPKGERIKA
jgi:4-methylaminobutanoate oxidase (formaldehyde-forming)